MIGQKVGLVNRLPFTGPRGLVLTERHDIVYRAPRATRTPPPR